MVAERTNCRILHALFNYARQKTPTSTAKLRGEDPYSLKLTKHYSRELSIPKFLFNFTERRSMMISVKD